MILKWLWHEYTYDGRHKINKQKKIALVAVNINPNNDDDEENG